MTTQASQPPRSGTAVTPYRLTVRQFLKAVEAGVFPPDARMELLGGIPVRKMTTHPPHNSTVYRLGYALRLLLPADWLLFEEKPIATGRRWRPVPDLSVVRGPIDRYLRDDPQAADVVLAIEVTDSTYPKDRGPKWQGYALAGVPIYWIVNIDSRRVEVYADPVGQGASASYRSEAFFGKGEAVPVVLGGVEVGRVAVNDFML